MPASNKNVIRFMLQTLRSEVRDMYLINPAGYDVLHVFLDKTQGFSRTAEGESRIFKL